MSERHKKILELLGACRPGEFTIADLAALLKIWALYVSRNDKTQFVARPSDDKDGPLLDAIYERWCQDRGYSPDDLDERLINARECAAQTQKTWKT